MLVLAVIAMGIPCMTGQTASRQKAPVLSALATQEAPPSDPRVTLPQMLVRPEGGAGNGIRSMVCGNLPLPTLGDQIRQATGGVEIWGYVETSDKPEGASKVAHKGVWKVNLSGNFSPLLERDLGGCYSAVIVDSIYYFFTITDLGSYKLPVNYGRHIGTWESVKVPDVTYTTDIPYALCTDGYTVWGQFYKDNKYIFGSYDLTKMKHTAIAECEGQWNAMAYGNDGNIYAIDMSGKLLQVVPKTGATTLN